MPHQVFDLYTKLIYEDGLLTEQEEFLERGVDKEIVENGLTTTVHFYYLDSLNFVTQLNYDEFLKWRSKSYKSHLVKDIETLLAGTSKEEFNPLILKLNYDFETLTSQVNKSKSIQRMFLEDLLSAKPEIQGLMELFAKMKGIIDISIMPNNDQESPSKVYPKLQWLGKTNVLLTLFYDLINGQDSGEPLIVAHKNDIKVFLLNNFIGSDGKPLSESTITTLFSPGREDKRANKGERVELTNVRLR